MTTRSAADADLFIAFVEELTYRALSECGADVSPSTARYTVEWGPALDRKAYLFDPRRARTSGLSVLVAEALLLICNSSQRQSRADSARSAAR
jgi:hypothetical protein